MGKFTYSWNILGTVQIWVYLPGPQMINLPTTRMNLIWVNLPSVKSELSWVNLPTTGTFGEKSRSSLQMINLLTSRTIKIWVNLPKPTPEPPWVNLAYARAICSFEYLYPVLSRSYHREIYACLKVHEEPFTRCLTKALDIWNRTKPFCLIFEVSFALIIKAEPNCWPANKCQV